MGAYGSDESEVVWRCEGSVLARESVDELECDGPMADCALAFWARS